MEPSPPPAPDSVAYLSLSSRIDCHAILDYQDWEWARQWLWCHTYGSGSMDPLTGNMQRPDHIYARRCLSGGRTLWLHREILTRFAGPPPPSTPIGDHRNGHTLDCRRANLRWATRAQNTHNRPGTRVRSRFARAVPLPSGN